MRGSKKVRKREYFVQFKIKNMYIQYDNKFLDNVKNIKLKNCFYSIILTTES